MGHWNTHLRAHMNDMHGAQQNQPCIFYENFTSLSQRHPQTGIPGLRNGFAPELHEGAVNFGVPQINSIQPGHPVPNLDLNFPPPSGHYSQYLEPPSCAGDFPIQVPHRALDTHGIGCFPASSYSRNIPYMDDIRGAYKSKVAEGIHGHYQYHNASAGPSFSIPPTNVAETSSFGGIRNQPCVIGAEPFLVHNANQLVMGSYASPSIQMPGNHWSDINYHVNNEVAWRPAPEHYPHGHVSFRGFQVPANNGSSHPFAHLPPHMGHPSAHQPALSMLVPRDAAATDLASPGFHYGRRPRGAEVESSARLQAYAQMRLLPEDETAILEIPGYHESQDPADQHRDMRLDIDHMSYEELLALEDQIGVVGTGLPRDFIRCNLKTRACTPLTAPRDQQVDFCVICQSSYEEEAGEIATLKCEHEYHRECLEKWLVIKNTCPICKATALTSNRNL